MNEQPTQNPQEEVEQPVDEFRVVREFFQQYGKTLVAGTAAVFAVVIAVIAFRARTEAKQNRAGSMLFTAQSIEDLQIVADQYRSTPAAPLSLLKLAKARFSTGDYDAALADYELFADRFQNHPLRATADLGRAHCLEARGQIGDALEAFESFLTHNPEHFLTPQAFLGKARCLEQLDRLDEARIVYEDFIVTNPGGIWTSRAEDMLESMEQRKAFAASRPAATFGPASGLGDFTWPEFPAVEESAGTAPEGSLPDATNQPAD